MDEPWNTVRWYAEHIAAITFLPAVLTHELAHYVGYRIFGYDAEIVLSDLKFSKRHSHIKSRATPNHLESFILGVVLPTLLVIPAFSLLLFVIQYELSPVVSAFLLYQGFGFLMQAGPSRADTRGTALKQFRANAEKEAAMAIASANGNEFDEEEWESSHPTKITDRISLSRRQFETYVYKGGWALTFSLIIVWSAILFAEYPEYNLGLRILEQILELF